MPTLRPRFPPPSIFNDRHLVSARQTHLAGSVTLSIGRREISGVGRESNPQPSDPWEDSVGTVPRRRSYALRARGTLSAPRSSVTPTARPTPSPAPRAQIRCRVPGDAGTGRPARRSELARDLNAGRARARLGQPSPSRRRAHVAERPSEVRRPSTTRSPPAPHDRGAGSRQRHRAPRLRRRHHRPQARIAAGFGRSPSL